MTGSGKTGLCLALLEEAAIDGIPAIIIDPKGDLGNLLLTFPDLRAEDFRPWVNADDAQRKGLELDAYAAQQADMWKKGLAAWGEGPERIRALREKGGHGYLHPGKHQRHPGQRPRVVRSAERRTMRRRLPIACKRRLPASSVCSSWTPIRSRVANTFCSPRYSLTSGSRAAIGFANAHRANPESAVPEDWRA